MATGEDKGSIQGHQARMTFPLGGSSCVGKDSDSSSHGGTSGPVGVSKARSGGSTIDALSAGVQSEPKLENAETMTKKPSIPKENEAGE